MSATESFEADRDCSLSFGPFCLRARRRQLLCNQRMVKIGSRALDLLIALTERPGEVIGQRELMERVWPDTAVEESGLRVQVAALRRVLGDGRGGVRYISTVPGRGYCFVAEVRLVHEATPLPVRSPRAPAPMAERAGVLDEPTSLAVSMLYERLATGAVASPLSSYDVLALEQLCRRLEHLASALRTALSRFAAER